MKILICGDTHGEWNKLNTLINKKHPDELWICGDFGAWPSFDRSPEMSDLNYALIRRNHKPWNFKGIKNPNTIVRFCDGNHEELPYLFNLTDPEIMPNVFYQKRGSVTTLPDGRNVLWIGGASSIDKWARTPGHDWFPEEVITQREVWDLPDINIDIVISHTCPMEFLPHIGIKNLGKVNDPSCKALSYVLEKYKPKLWKFGHWHSFKEGYDCGCHWTCLNMASDSGWWEWLK